jgi:hypothetical protein
LSFHLGGQQLGLLPQTVKLYWTVVEGIALAGNVENLFAIESDPYA